MFAELLESKKERDEKMDSDKGVVLVYSGPSGSGKGTILKKIRELHNNLFFSVSATTRSPREGEIEGEHYFFKTIDQFVEMINKDELLEWVLYCDNYYGTPKSFVTESLDNGKDIVIEVEVEGAILVKKNFPECVSVFVMPPTFDSLRQRIEKRGSETKETMSKRLMAALNEISLAKNYDYIIVNDDLETAVKQLDSIIIAEKTKRNRKKRIIEQILKEGHEHEGK